MKIDLHTLTIAICLSNFLQVIILFSQYRLNKNQNGLIWWALGNVSLTMGFGINILRDTPAFEQIAIVANNAFFISAFAFFHVGVLRFFGQRTRHEWLTAFCALIIVWIIYFTYINNDMVVRRVSVSVILVTISFLTARAFLLHRNRSVAASAYFLAIVFLANGCFFIVRALALLTGYPAADFFTPSVMLTATFLVILVTSTLATFGFVFLLNQQLTAQYLEAKVHFELIFETSPHAILISRLSDGCMLEINNGFTVMTGFTRGDVIGKSAIEMNIWKNPSDRQKIITLLRERGFCRDIEAVLQRKDVTEFIGLISARLIDMHGTSHIISETSDITERIAAEEALRESEARYRMIVDTASEGILTLDSDARITFANRQMASMLGYSIEEMLGQQYEFFLPEDQLSDNREQMKIRAQGQDSTYERCFRRKDGAMRWILVSAKAIIDAEGRFAGSFAMFIDINERKLLEESIMLHNRRLQQLLSLAQMKETEMQVVLDQALEYAIQLTGSTIGYIYYYNEVEQQFVLNSWSKDVMKECTIVEPQTVYQLNRTGIWGEAVRQRKPVMVNDFQADNPLKKGYPEGHVHLQRFLTVPVFSEGDIVAVIGVGNKSGPYDDIDVLQLNLLAESIWSISRMKDDERKIRQYALELKKLNSTKDMFFSIIAHDLRGPFNGIINLSGLLMDSEKKSDTAAVAEYVALIHESGKNVYTLLENLLEWARIQMNKVEFKPENLVFRDVLNNTLQLLRDQAMNKHISIEQFSNVADVYADANMLASILRNLISNAIKFTPQSGTVTIRALDDEHNVEISVIDTGTGIAPELQERLFKLSENTTEQGTEGEKGTGLGLLLCKEFIEVHGGAIRIESEEGKGSAFIFTLPRPEAK
ncbi:MAG: PAS domain S-box protein [Candidatus Xenobiia bacterium LiM19]